MQAKNDIPTFASLMLSVLAALMSLGGIAYASGTLTDRVAHTEERLNSLDEVNERLARIETKLDMMGAKEDRRAHGR